LGQKDKERKKEGKRGGGTKRRQGHLRVDVPRNEEKSLGVRQGSERNDTRRTVSARGEHAGGQKERAEKGGGKKAHNGQRRNWASSHEQRRGLAETEEGMWQPCGVTQIEEGKGKEVEH